MNNTKPKLKLEKQKKKRGKRKKERKERRTKNLKFALSRTIIAGKTLSSCFLYKISISIDGGAPGAADAVLFFKA